MAYRYIDDGYPESDDYSDNYEWYDATGAKTPAVAAITRQRALPGRRAALGTGRRLATFVCRFGRGVLRRFSFAA